MMLKSLITIRTRISRHRLPSNAGFELISLIVAMSENNVIGRDGDMPWHISDDLKRFKRLTMGHHIIMGRRTFDSIGRLLPGRTTIVLTRQPEFKIDGGLVANHLKEAIDFAGDDPEIFIVGGGEVYQMALPQAEKIYLTRVHTILEGDTTFPVIDWDDWQLIDSEQRRAGAKNDFDFSFQTYQRNLRSMD